MDESRPPSTRDRIVSGARVVFERLGYEATRVEDILQEAGVSRPTFYRVFRNKEEVYAEITDAEVPRQRSARERVLEGAREAFGRLGYEGTRVEDILEASGVSRPTFYRVFSSKQDAFEILDEIAVQYLARAIDRHLVGDQGAVDHLELVVASYFEWRVGLGVCETGVHLADEAPGVCALRRAALAKDDEDAPSILGFALVCAVEALCTSFASEPSAEQIASRRRQALALIARTSALPT